MSTSMAPTRSKRAAALPPEERRSTIVEATLPLLLEYGDRVTTRQIAEAAGIAEGTIFRVFADKDEIISAVVESALDPAPFEDAVASIPDDLPFEATLAEAVVLIQQRVLDIWHLVSSVGSRFHDTTRGPLPDSEALTARLRAHRDRIRVEPLLAARLLRALTLSTTHPMLTAEPASAEEIVQVFLHGVGAKDASC